MLKQARFLLAGLVVAGAALLPTAAQEIPLGVLVPLTGGGAAEVPYLRNAAE